MNFTVLVEHKMKEKEKDKYLDLVKELKKAMKVTVIPIGVEVLWKIKRLKELEIKGRCEIM